MDLSSVACENFVLSINTKKTVAIHRPPFNTVHIAQQINVNGTQLQMVNNLMYLGSVLSRTTNIDGEVARRISKASQTIGRLQNTVCYLYGL
nr:unnamed protein product [Spirometra erinaceieuropaei]